MILFLWAIFGIEPARSDSAWTYVPASVNGRSLDVLSIAEAPTEKVISFVGKDVSVPHRASEPRRVCTFGLPVASTAAAGLPVPAPKPDAVPGGAHWPDANGRITFAPTSPATAATGLRNPWEVRVHKGPVGVETAFLCGGIIAGGDAGPIAILNGHLVRQGDTLGQFGIARVIAAGVVLERSGSYFVIPRGTRTIVTAVDG